jgi:hypothetical protein
VAAKVDLGLLPSPEPLIALSDSLRVGRVWAASRVDPLPVHKGHSAPPTEGTEPHQQDMLPKLGAVITRVEACLRAFVHEAASGEVVTAVAHARALTLSSLAYAVLYHAHPQALLER